MISWTSDHATLFGNERHIGWWEKVHFDDMLKIRPITTPVVPKGLGPTLATFKADSRQYMEDNSHEPQAAKRGRKALAASDVILFFDVKDTQDKIKAKEFS